MANTGVNVGPATFDDTTVEAKKLAHQLDFFGGRHYHPQPSSDEPQTIDDAKPIGMAILPGLELEPTYI